MTPIQIIAVILLGITETGFTYMAWRDRDDGYSFTPTAWITVHMLISLILVAVAFVQ